MGALGCPTHMTDHPPRTRSLSRTHAARGGVPRIDHVDLVIFERRYFMKCLDCL